MKNQGDTNGISLFAPAHSPRWICLTLLFISTFLNIKAQRPVDYAVHANIIYHFTKYINWPDERKTGDFIIGIFGDSPVYDELNKIVSTKQTGRQKIVVRKLSAGTTDFDAHILFISEEESNSLKKIVAKTEGLPVLLIGEEEGMSTRGTCINFMIVNDRLKLEINKNTIEKRHLNIASELLSLGKSVR